MRAIEPEVRDIPEQRERPSRRTDGPLVVIFNPEARAAKAGEIAAETLAEAFHAHGVETRLAPCESEERSAEVVAEVVAEAVRADARAVIAVGGDGTVHAIVRALVEAGRQSDGGTSGEATALGIVPLGTMNNIACALCIPEDLDGAIDVIAAGDTRPLDLGVADGQPFVEVAGAGLMADLFPIMEAVKGRPWMIPASLAARRSGVLPGDLAITQAIQRRRTPARDLFFTAVAEPGFPPWGAVGVFLPAALFWRAQLRLEALFMLLGGGTDAVNFVIKRVVRRQRPADPLVRVVRIIREPSFPSGHVMHYLATFGFLAAAAVANLRPSQLRRAVVAACAAMIALVGPSRVYLGAHWPSDVGAGYVCGGLYLGGMLELYAWAKRRQAEEHEHTERPS